MCRVDLNQPGLSFLQPLLRVQVVRLPVEGAILRMAGAGHQTKVERP